MKAAEQHIQKLEAELQAAKDGWESVSRKLATQTQEFDTIGRLESQLKARDEELKARRARAEALLTFLREHNNALDLRQWDHQSILKMIQEQRDKIADYFREKEKQ